MGRVTGEGGRTRVDPSPSHREIGEGEASAQAPWLPLRGGGGRAGGGVTSSRRRVVVVVAVRRRMSL